MEDVAQINESRRGDEDDLHHPEADVRNGEGLVVADVLTTGLLGVAGEARLLVAPHLLSGGSQHQDAEDEQHRQPDFAHNGGVFLGTFQQLPQQVPVPHTASRI